MHVRFEVSVKAAIYSLDRQKVLVMSLQNNLYGLPGGHIEQNEQPDDAMERELFEEIGVRDLVLERKDFFIHGNGRIILAYVTELDHRILVGSTETISEGTPLWLSMEQFHTLNIDRGYKQFVLDNWPVKD